MTATDPTLAALLSAVEQFPDDDTPRLLAADRLDELAGDLTPRAELIRVQVELARGLACEWEAGGGGPCPQYNARLGPGRVNVYCPTCAKAERLRARERDLLARHGDAFRRGPACAVCGGNGRETIGGRIYSGPCPDCLGTGDAGGLTQRSMEDDPHSEKGGRECWRRTVTWERGFPVVFAALAECVTEQEEQCPECFGRTGEYRYPADDPTNKLMHGNHWYTCTHCSGNGYTVTRAVPSPWLRRVVRHHRGVEVRLTDREPYHGTIRPGSYEMMPHGTSSGTWFDANTEAARSHLPTPLFRCLDGGDLRNPQCRDYCTPDAARVALGRAIAKFARGRQAGQSPGKAVQA
jgi:uncharacterized protein (TIGR02996 family)